MSEVFAKAFRSTGAGIGVNEEVPIASGNASLLATAAGATTLIAARPLDRRVIIVVTVATTFDAGNGAAPIFDFGETGAAEKFKADLNTGTAGATITYAGVLSGGKDLIVTATAATGTGAGAIDVVAIALP